MESRDKSINDSFQFEISLSVLNHLGRNLYRNFITVLGEAISNSWDADANNVWIEIDRKNNSFTIKDDGSGMDADSFQNKFLKIGYSKRKENGMQSPKGRPYIGAKGIGKLALLSCAETISVISKTAETDFVGGLIDNAGLEEAITKDLTPQDYLLGEVNIDDYKSDVSTLKQGTIIHFENTKEDIKNTVPYIKKLIALYFRFVLHDKNFSIHVNGEKVALADIADLSEKTEFVWLINDFKDPFIDTFTELANDPVVLVAKDEICGFIATVEKPRDLKVIGTQEKVGVDLFVNGRLREKNLLRHNPTARITESYIYGQIHCDYLDSDGKDRFTSSREGVVENDERYQELLSELKDNILPKILDQWDELRLARGEDGDDDNPRKSPKERRAGSLYNLSANDFTEHIEDTTVKSWVRDLQPDAEFNIPAYVDCFLSENLIRRFIEEEKIPLTDPAKERIAQWKDQEKKNKKDANLNFPMTQHSNDLDYLGMDFLAKVADNDQPNPNRNSLVRDAVEFKPIRNAVSHTALLSGLAKDRLRIVLENIKGRIRILLNSRGKGSG